MTNFNEGRSFLFATWEGGGNIPPMLTVVRKLVARGHRVRVMSDSCNRPECEAAGAEFVAWTRAPSRVDRSPATDVQRDWDVEEPQQGLLRLVDHVIAGPALGYAEDVIAEIRRAPADLVVSSEFLPGVAVGCEALGQRYALLAVNISLYPMPGVPPMGPGLAPPRSEAERELHAAIAEGTKALFDHGLPALNAARKAFGLSPLDSILDHPRRAERLFLATSRAFDFAPQELPANVRYVGPQLGEPGWVKAQANSSATEDNRPLVAVCFSTTFQNHTGVLQKVIDALATLPVRAVVTLGGSIAASDLRAGANVTLVNSMSHDALMSEAALVVTHGGHGTVMRALAHRRPMLVIPHGRDQNDNAVRVVTRGAGLSLAPDADVGTIRTALTELLEQPGFARRAAELGDQVAAEAADSPIVEELEALAASADESTLLLTRSA